MSEGTPSRSEAGSTALFVRRPVLAFVLNTLIAVAGLIVYKLCRTTPKRRADRDRPSKQESVSSPGVGRR